MIERALSRGGHRAAKIIGQRFGNLVVLEKTNERRHGGIVYACFCDCGETIKALSSNLKRKNSPITHCGCKGMFKNGRSVPGGRGVSTDYVREIKPAVAFSSLRTAYKQGAISRGIQWGLTDSQFMDLVQGNCFYCGIEPQQVHIREPHRCIYNGIDRLDSSGSYNVGNCAACCGDCNKAKNDRSIEDFLTWVKRVYKYQQSR